MKKIIKPMFLKKFLNKKTEELNDNSIVMSEGKKSDDKNKIVINDNVYFNTITKCYVVFLKSAGKNVVLGEDTVKSLYRNYSKLFGDSATIEELARSLFKWPRAYVEELIKIFGLTHSVMPVTPYELHEKNDNEIIEDISAHRRFILHQKLEHKTWHEIQAQSLKWQEFQYNIVAPMQSFLEKWQPPKVEHVEPDKYDASGDILLISLNDLHVGSLTNKSKVFSEKDFNTSIALAGVEKYLAEIKYRLEQKKDRPYKAFVLFNGDIVHSFVDNFTRRGTQLHSEYVNEDLFRIGLDLVINFISRVSTMFKETEVVIGRGNHEGPLALYLGFAAKKYFSSHPTIKLSVEDKWIFSRWLNNVYVLCSHGAHDTFKGISVPRGQKLQIFIQNHLLEKSKEISRAGQKICILGHLHSQYVEDLGGFTVIRCGSGVVSDEHGQALGHFTRPYQNCILLGQNNVRDIWNCFL